MLGGHCWLCCRGWPTPSCRLCSLLPSISSLVQHTTVHSHLLDQQPYCLVPRPSVLPTQQSRLSVPLLPAQKPRFAVWPLPAAHPSASPSCPYTTSIWTHRSALLSLCQCGQGFLEGRAVSDLFQRPQDSLRWALNKSLVSGTAFEARGSGGPGVVLTKTGFKLQPPSQQ